MKSGLEVVDHSQEVVTAISQLLATKVLIGYPGETAERKPLPGEPVELNNPTLAYIHETGAPEKNIPARPHLVVGVVGVINTLTAWMMKAGKAAFAGDVKGMMKAFNGAGFVGMSAVKNKISSGPFLPLAESTILARERRGREVAVSERLQSLRARGVKVSSGEHEMFTGTRPLIDTAAMQGAVNYVLRTAKR